jgi:TRAP-type C4-dicarboxylate transport system permease small subunit
MIEAGQRLMLKVEFVLATVAAVCLLAVMCIVFVDVGARYFLNAPLAWSYELIGMYLMPALFYLALSDTLADHHHIAVDLLRSRMPDWLIRVIEIVGCGAMCALFALMVWIHLQSTVHDLATGAVTMGVIEWPAWIPAALVVVGSSAIALRLLGRAVGHAVSLATGRPLIALPAIVEV